MNGNDKNVWLGRSQFNDPFFNGKYNEFRLYKGAMTPAQVSASFAAGPEQLPSTSPAPTIGVQRTGNNLVVSWPATSEGFHAEATTALGPGATWTQIGDGTPATGGQFQVSIPLTEAVRFIRLVR
jgi:hypothetical protein